MELQVKRVSKIIETFERRAKRDLGRVLKKQALFLAEKIPSLLDTKSATVFLYKKDLQSDIYNELARSGLNEELAEEVIRYMGLSLIAGNKTLVMSLKQPKSFLFSLKDPQIVRILAERKKYELSNYRGNLTGTTKEKIAEVVAKTVMDGGSIDDIKKAIMLQAEKGVFSNARAELIAITEVGKAFGESQQMTARSISNATGRQIFKRWITVGDDKVRATHARNASLGWVDINQAFEGTGDAIAPSSDFRCRCTMAHSFTND